MSILNRRALVGLVILVAWSCADTTSVSEPVLPEDPDPGTPTALQHLEQPLAVVPSLPAICGDPTQTGLMLGPDIHTGTVEVTNDETNLFVRFTSDDGRPILATALFVGDSPNEIPTNRWGFPRLLRFPYKSGHDFGTTEVVWEIPRSEVSVPEAVIAAYAQVGLLASWGEGDPITPGRGWAMYFTHSLSNCAAETVDGAGGTLTTPDGNATLDIPAGALSAPVDITIEPATVDELIEHAGGIETWGPTAASAAVQAVDVPALPNGVIPIEGTVWDFGPDGLQFDKPVTVTLHYEDTKLPLGVDENLLGLFIINGVFPAPPEAIVDPIANTVTAEIDHFSYGFIGFLPPQDADLSISSLTESADAIELGQEVTYTATLSNLGPAAISDGVVYYLGFGDIVAGSLSTGCTEQSPIIATVEIVCEVGSLSSGASADAPSASFIPQVTGGPFEVWVDPGSADTDDPDLTNNRATDSYTVTDRVADLQIVTLSDAPDPAAVGEDIVYSVQLSSAPGTAQPVEGATLLFGALGDATFVSATDESCFGTPLGVTCPVPTLQPGLVFGVDVTLRPNDGVSTLSVVVEVEPPFGTIDPNLDDNLAIETTTIGSSGAADLSVSNLAESADPIALGESVSYTATLQNFGPNGVSDAVVYYQIFGDVVAGPLNSACTETSAPAVADVEIVCTVGQIDAPGVTLAPWATFTPRVPGEFTVWVSPGSSATDPNTANNRFETTVTVNGPSADLRVDRVSDNADPVPAGTDVTYEVDVIAMGATQSVDGAVLRVLFAGDATLQSSTSSCSIISGGIGCPLAPLQPGLVHTVQAVMTLSTPGQTVTAEATVVVPAGIDDPDLSNNTLSETTTVGTAGPSSISVGQLITGVLPAGGQVHTYSFNGAVGQLRRIHLAMGEGSTGSAELILLSPSGAELYPNSPSTAEGRATNLSSANHVAVLPENGTYLIKVESLGSGPYRVGLGTGEGRLDTSFGSNGTGTVTESASSNPSNPFLQMELVGDGMVTIGELELGRFDGSGARMAGFGSGGSVDLRAATGLGINGTAMRIQPDGKIVVAASSYSFPYPWVVARFEADGALDTSFGTGGSVEIPLGTRSSSKPVGIRFQQNGADLDIVVAGNAGNLQEQVGIIRLNPNGTLDTGFGTNGIVEENGGIGPRYMDIQSDGKILVSGSDDLRRYTATGARDTSFGTDGLIPLGTGGFVRGLRVLPNDDILLLGDRAFDAFVLRLNSDGTSDASFAGGGLGVFDFGARERAIDATEDGAGNLIVVGHQRTVGGDYEFMVMRMSASGILDPDFGVGGYLVELRVDEARAVELDTQGRIVVGGQRMGSVHSIHLTRHIPY